jgi:hypothetical protein
MFPNSSLGEGGLKMAAFALALDIHGKAWVSQVKRLKNEIACH